MNIVISKSDPRIFDGKKILDMNIPSTVDGFLQTLEEAQKVTQDPDIKNYITNIVPIVKTYQQVDADLKSSEAKQQKAYEVINAQN